MKLFLIAKSNIKKSKGASIVLFILLMFSTVMLYTSITVLGQVPGFVEEKREELNCADAIYLVENEYKEKAKEIVVGMNVAEVIEESNTINCLNVDTYNLTQGGNKGNLPTLICPYKKEQTLNLVKPVGEFEELTSEGVYLPYCMSVSNGYQVGDEIEVTINGTAFVYTVQGFYEDIMFSTPAASGEYQFYVSQDSLEKIRSKVNESLQYTMVHLRMKPGVDVEEFVRDFVEEYRSKVSLNSNITVMNSEDYEAGTMVFVNIMMAIVMAFALILIVISIVIIRFSINVQLERNMANIGALQAIGYTTGQISRSIMLQFLMISSGAIITGLVGAVILSSIISGIVILSVGLDWVTEISISSLGITIGVILIAIYIITMLAARKIRKITPLMALRSGIQTHNFKKNHIPLKSTKRNLNVVIGIKNLFHSMKQNVVILIIISLLAFAGVFSMVMFYNFCIDDKGILNIVGIEYAQLQVSAESETIEKFKEELLKKPEIKKAVNFENAYMVVKHNEHSMRVIANVADDFSELELQKVVKGSTARYDNEVNLTNLVADKLGVEMGDSITVSFGGAEKEYIVVGISQQMNQMGQGIMVPSCAVKRMLPDYSIASFYVYLEDGVDTEQYLEDLVDEYKEEPVLFYNNEKMLSTSLESFSSAIKMVCIIFGVISSIVIILILLLLISLKIVKEQRNYGIFKAIGYTTKQLMVQMLFSFLPIIAIGIVLGILFGVLCSNPLIGVMLKGMGIAKASFIIHPLFVTVIPCLIGVVAIATILFTSLKLRKVTPTNLFYE